MNNIIYIVDAYAHIYRGYHAIQSLKTKDGKPSNAVFALCKFLLSIRKDFKPQYGAFVFDKGAPADRLKIHPSYKANRPGMPDDMRCQIETIKELIVGFGWTIIEKDGYEADDLIATIATSLNPRSVKILTNDKDISQVVDDRITILAVNSFTKEVEERNIENVIKKYGVKPDQIVDYLSMIGDSSDNIPGLPGVGPKTAAKLLEEFGNIENIYLSLDKLKTEKLRSLFADNREILRRNVSLITLDRNIPIDGIKTASDLNLKAPNCKILEKIASEYELRSLHCVLEELGDRAPIQESLFDF